MEHHRKDDPRLLPSQLEVETLPGDPTRAKERWAGRPTTTLEEAGWPEMVACDKEEAAERNPFKAEMGFDVVDPMENPTTKPCH